MPSAGASCPFGGCSNGFSCVDKNGCTDGGALTCDFGGQCPPGSICCLQTSQNVLFTTACRAASECEGGTSLQGGTPEADGDVFNEPQEHKGSDDDWERERNAAPADKLRQSSKIGSILRHGDRRNRQDEGCNDSRQSA